jgi:hypothetical protein
VFLAVLYQVDHRNADDPAWPQDPLPPNPEPRQCALSWRMWCVWLADAECSGGPAAL